MNPAAKLVIFVLAIIAVITVVTLCALAWKSGDGAVIKDIALLVIGAISGVLAKVGYDVAKDQLPLTPDGEAVKTKEQ